MSTNNTSPLFSRIVFILGGVSVLGLAYWFIQTSLAPVEVPSVPTQRGTVRFDPSLDVAKQETFFRLRALGPAEINLRTPGRVNPFTPPIVTTATAATIPQVVPAATPTMAPASTGASTSTDQASTTTTSETP